MYTSMDSRVSRGPSAPLASSKRTEKSALQAFHHFKSTASYHCKRTYLFFYGVATVSRLLKIIGLFCRISSLV